MCRPRSRFESRFRRGGSVPLELIGRIAPTRTEGINLRGIFRFPVERYVDKILPFAEKTTVGRATAEQRKNQQRYEQVWMAG